MSNGELTFLVVNDPSETTHSAYRRSVKSQAARHNWRKESQGARKRASNSSARQVLTVKFAVYQHEADSNVLQPTYSNASQGALRSVLGEGRVDPFQSYPCFHPCFPQLVDHYIVFMTPDVPEIDQPDAKGLLRSRWFPFVLTEQSTFLAVMLLAAAHISSLTATTHRATEILQLKANAMRSINYLISTSNGAISDSLIGAVAKMASFEAMYGEIAAYRSHMSGLRKMIHLRGGLDRLGLGGLLRRLVIWIDTNAAFLNKIDYIFVDEITSDDGELRIPNPSRFIGD